MTHNCRKCGVELDDENWSPAYQKGGNYICKTCNKEYCRSYRENNREKEIERHRLYRENNPEEAKASSTKHHRKNGVLPMSENKECASYMGVYVNERLLRHYFNDVEVMPYGNKGYDIVCNHGKKIDGKSCCIRKNGNSWTFIINHNTIADYFVLVAYGNRKDMNPLHIWLIPGHVLNHAGSVSISPSTIDKWDEYELDINEVVACCDTMKEQ